MEVLAPAGSFESLAAAIQAGCDSVYFGVEQLNMRSQSANFKLEDLDEIVKRCKEAGIRCYLTLNTLLYEHDMSLMQDLLQRVKQSGVDAVIASDWAAIGHARELGIEVHISTQMSVSNMMTVRMLSQFSDRIVLARELSLPLVAQICKTIADEELKGPNGRPLEIEVFVHGAMCVAVSGRCHMSLHTNNSSANRGACVQNCRKAYRVIDEETGQELVVDNKFVMSPEDLCTIDFLDKLLDAGVHTLKIEGRGRAPDYVHTVVTCYREAVEAYKAGTFTQEKVKEWKEKLSSVYNRGLSSGYFLGKHMDSWSGVHSGKATKKKVKLGKVCNYFKQAGVAHVALESGELKVGDEILITGPTTGVVRSVIESLQQNEQAVDKAIKGDDITFSVDLVRKGDTLFRIDANENTA